MQIAIQGLTGTVRFDSRGFRSDFALRVLELSKHGLVEVGSWTPNGGVTLIGNYSAVVKAVTVTKNITKFIELDDEDEPLKNKTLTVATLIVRNVLNVQLRTNF